MRSVRGIAVLVGAALALSLPVSALQAEEGAKALPVLLIKGEIVSLDTNDPTAALLKVKDRYGFETPIYVTQDAKIQQGEAAVPVTSLTVGSTVNVEYNFDVNTAKRHAVSVKVDAPASPMATPPAATPAPDAPAAPDEMMPEESSTPVPEAEAPVTSPSASEEAPSPQ